MSPALHVFLENSADVFNPDITKPPIENTFISPQLWHSFSDALKELTNTPPEEALSVAQDDAINELQHVNREVRPAINRNHHDRHGPPPDNDPLQFTTAPIYKLS